MMSLPAVTKAKNYIAPEIYLVTEKNTMLTTNIQYVEPDSVQTVIASWTDLHRMWAGLRDSQ